MRSDHSHELIPRECTHCGHRIYLLELAPGLLAEWRHIRSNTVHCDGHRHDAEPRTYP